MSFGLTVSIKKTEVLRQLAPNTARPPPNITMDGNALKNVDTFKYLGSCINSAANLEACNIPVDEWQALAQDRRAWRAATRKGTKHFERSRLQSLDDKRSARKNRVPNPSTAVPCQLCGKICASTFGLQAHMRKHQH